MLWKIAMGDVNPDDASNPHNAEKILNDLQVQGWEIMTTEVVQNPTKIQLVIIAKKRNY